VLVPGELTVEHPAKSLHRRVGVERFPLGAGMVTLCGVILRIRECLANHRCHSEAGGRGLVLTAVHSCRVLPECAFHADFVGEHRVERGTSPCFDTDGASADRIATTGLDHNARHATQQRVVEPDLVRVDTVHRTKPGAVRISHLVRVVAGPTLAVLVHTEMSVRVHESGQYPRACDISDVCVGGHVDVAIVSDVDDPAVGDQHRATVDRFTVDGHNIATSNRLSHRLTL